MGIKCEIIYQPPEKCWTGPGGQTGMVAAFKVQLKSVWPLVLVAWFSMYLSCLAWCSHLIPTPPLLSGYKSSPSRLSWVAQAAPPQLAGTNSSQRLGRRRKLIIRNIRIFLLFLFQFYCPHYYVTERLEKLFFC